ncbi:MAG: DUF2835 family protein [Succinivibrio dextrinosolvens]|uniref:DUF2835 family protein n=1 Tax=Succinivibrio sp. TaxID=2053619 RepID=UPI0025F6409C|nr:DUF2835 family protein [Succinivibrio sp.]MBQ9220680.1 DUF2835 family protein [Succinivibrio sp.]MDY6419476.1 DUF2835 family protein [Succinivibrio dextrinosolvens]MDY6466554.1 DUF2835 family protein [Succinivibrio dextrinosolvens]
MFGENRYRFSLSMSKQTLLSLYKGAFQRVRVRTFEGLVIDIDANHLKNFTTEDGIHGIFELVTTSSNKFVKLIQIE